MIFFPKILNELDGDTRDRLFAAAGKCRLDTDVDECYFCASHSKSAAGENGRFLERFINALGNRERHSYSGSVSAFFDLERDGGFRNRWGLKEKNMLTETDGIYELRRDEKRIRKLNADFFESRTDGEMKKTVDNVKQTDADAENIFRHRITRVKEIAFQIVRLKKKPKLL